MNKFLVSTVKIALRLLYQTNKVIMKFSIYLKSLTQRIALLLAIGLAFSNFGYSQKVTFLEVPVKLEVEKGDLDGVVVKVKKDGKDAFTQSGASKMRFKLDFDKKYSLIFTKDGYITKTIEINTSAPADRINKGFEAYKIGVKLYKQGEENNTVVYNQPVARIKYDQNIDEFNFDTDYSKSILSAIALDNDEEKTAAPAPVPPTPTPTPAPVAAVVPPSPPAPTPVPPTPAPTPEPVAAVVPPAPAAPAPVVTPEPPVVVKKEVEKPKEEVVESAPIVASAPVEEKPIITPQAGIETQKEEPTAVVEKPKKIAPNSSGDDSKRKIKPSAGKEPPNKINMNAGEESQKRLSSYQSGQEQFKTTASVNSGMDLSNNPGAFSEQEKITREDIVEKNRVIVKVTVIKGSKISEYSCVNYAWGGRFFFKDNKTSINENLFVQWTGIRP